jgi:arylsulfatase A-like enzyme
LALGNENNRAGYLGFPRTLLSRRQWVYLLSLLIPLIIYNLALKAYSVAALPGSNEPGSILGLMWSDLFFYLGYALLWIGLFAAVRARGASRRVVVVLFHVMTILVLVVATCAHQYLRQNGTTLDYSIIAEWIPKFGELGPIFAYDVPISAWLLLAAALFYATLGPLILVRAIGWWRGWPERSATETPEIFSSGAFGLCFLALGFGTLSLLTGTTTVARDPVLNVVMTGMEEAAAKEYDASVATEHPAAHAELAPGPETGKRNVALIHLESTRAQSVTPYNEELATTPFLDELSKSSLLMERAYTTVPRSSKASVGVNCGIEPPLYPGPEFEPGGIPVPCLASLLKDQGYRTVFFASTSNTMDNFDAVARGFGYEEIYSSEVMDREGFQVTNTFGYEEDIMLGPSKEWLIEKGNEPFLAQYFTGTGHYGYECVPNRYGYEHFSEDEELDRYHNCLRMLDHFLENLFEQYKELGLYEDTIFVLYGDHGEGFGEHGREMHGDTIWEEGLWIPLLVHAPGWFEGGERVEELASQIDILPTVLDMLGYQVRNGQYPGYSLLRPLPEDRTLNFSCITNRECLASLKGNEKYIHHYNNQPDELFDLSEDPLEQENLASEQSKEELDERRQRLFEWRTKVNAQYGKTYQ